MTDAIERELKLVPESSDLLDRLASVDHLGPFAVRDRRRELQRNVFFDSHARALRKARVGFRRRTVDGQQPATWSIKGGSQLVRGVTTRSEIELELDPDLAPALALGALRAAAQSRGAPALADAVGEALSRGGLPQARPFLESVTDRTLIDLVEPRRGWAVELALDRVRLVGHRYAEIEVEAELKHGDEAALQAAREAIANVGTVHASHGSKLSRAVDHLEHCDCPADAGPRGSTAR